MKALCPHCNMDMEMLSAGDLSREFGLSANQLQYLRDRGRLPEPWLKFANRYLYERGSIESYFDARIRERARRTVQLVKDLPERERGEALKMLRELDS